MGKYETVTDIIAERDALRTRVAKLERERDNANAALKLATGLCDELESRASAAEQRVRELERERKFYLSWEISEPALQKSVDGAEAAFDECESDDPKAKRLRNWLADTIDNFKQALRQRDAAEQRAKRMEGALRCILSAAEHAPQVGIDGEICTIARAALAASDCRCGHTDAEHYADAEARGRPCRECGCLGMERETIAASEDEVSHG